MSDTHCPRCGAMVTHPAEHADLCHQRRHPTTQGGVAGHPGGYTFGGSLGFTEPERRWWRCKRSGFVWFTYATRFKPSCRGDGCSRRRGCVEGPFNANPSDPAPDPPP